MKIVAPAGNMERFYSAISATADEIYLGLKGFGARRNAENFTVEELKKAIDYAHLRGSRIFLTLNTIMTNREIELLYSTLKDLYNYGLDAIIVQDLGYAEYLHKNFPSIEIHGSTQMTVANYYEINYLKELGFKRIVLPRELCFEDIKEKLSEIGDSEFTVKNIKIDIDENIFIPLSELKNIKRNVVEKFREKILSYFRRDLDSELKENNQEYFKLEIEKDESKDLEIRVIVSNEEQKNFLENIKDEYNIKEVYYRTYDIAKQSMLGQHNLDNKLVSNLYELLENKNSAVMLNWNMNIVNSYTISVLEKIEKLESFIVSPEINFSKIRELGKTRLKKALLIYSKLKGMTIDVDIADNKNEVITNKENDKFNIIKNEYGTEIFLDKPLNIINIMEDIKKLNVDIVVLEFTTETIEDIKKVLKQLKTRKGEYREYNYKRGVY